MTKLRRNLFFFCLTCVLCVVSLFGNFAIAADLAVEINVLDRKQWRQVVRDQVDNDSTATVRVALSSTLHFDAVIEGTAKGNALLRIANLVVRVYDDHDDAFVFDGGMLALDVVDIDNDTHSEIIFSGVGKKTHEKSGASLALMPIVLVLDYACDKRQFVARFSSSPVSLIYENDTSIRGPECR